MTDHYKLECMGETVVIERTDDGETIFHGWDRETEEVWVAMGGEPSACFIAWNAIQHDILDESLIAQSGTGNAAAIAALLFLGADASTDDSEAMYVAAEHQHVAVIRLLADAGADVNVSEGFPLAHAVSKSNYDMAQTLIDLDATMVIDDDPSLLLQAVHRHDPSMIRLLF